VIPIISLSSVYAEVNLLFTMDEFPAHTHHILKSIYMFGYKTRPAAAVINICSPYIMIGFDARKTSCIFPDTKSKHKAPDSVGIAFH
jgi:hypothetical protein